MLKLFIKYFMTGPEENGKFYFPIPSVFLGESQENMGASEKTKPGILAAEKILVSTVFSCWFM